MKNILRTLSLILLTAGVVFTVWPEAVQYIWDTYKETPYKGAFILKFTVAIVVVVFLGERLGDVLAGRNTK